MRRLLPGAGVLLALLLFDLRLLANNNWDPRVFVFERPVDLPADRPWGGGTGYGARSWPGAANVDSLGDDSGQSARCGAGQRDPGRVVGAALQLAFVAVMPKPTWEDPLAILRVGLGLLAALLVWLAAAHRRVLPFAVASWAPSALVLALAPGML